MRVRIEEQPLSHWMENFYGYGSWESKVWFVGYEESGGDLPEEVAEKLNHFYKTRNVRFTETLCDIRALYKDITFRVEGPRAEKYATFFDHRFGAKAVLHGLWKNLIAFSHGYRNQPLPDLLSYQRTTFVSPTESREMLIPFYPLPAHNHAWYYSWLDMPRFPFLKSRSLYDKHFYPTRIKYIFRNIKTYRPDVVVMYGMNNINELKKSAQEQFDATFRIVKATPRVIPQHHIADLGSTTLIITTQVPALRHNRIETGFDWHALGRDARSMGEAPVASSK